MPHFSLGPNNSLRVEVLYLKTNYSSFCYMVLASKLQLSQTCLMLNFVRSANGSPPREPHGTDRGVAFIRKPVAELPYSLFTLAM